MRRSLFQCLPLLLGLGACQSAGGDPESAWQEIQRERLLRLAEHRDPALVLERLRATAPQEPRAGRHLDQQEPRGIGRRRILGAVARDALTIEAGIGALDIDLAGTRFDARRPTARAEVGIEPRVEDAAGGGLRLSLQATDDAMFAGELLNDGLQPAHADARAVLADGFVYGRWHDAAGDTRQDWRLGLFVEWFGIDHLVADLDRTWLTLGPRLEWAPRVRLTGDAAEHLDLVGRVAADVGLTRFDEQYVGAEDDAVTWRVGAAVRAGLRYESGRWAIEATGGAESAWFGGTDTSLLGEVDHSARLGYGGQLGVTLRF